MRTQKSGSKATRELAKQTGYPIADPGQIRKLIAENPGKAKHFNANTVQLRQEQATQDASQPSSQYLLTVYDLYYGRVLRSELYDAPTNRLLQRTVCRYDKKGNEIKLKGVYSEGFLENAKTGQKLKEIRQQSFENVTFVNNL